LSAWHWFITVAMFIAGLVVIVLVMLGVSALLNSWVAP
jgi:hypothetical protein